MSLHIQCSFVVKKYCFGICAVGCGASKCRRSMELTQKCKNKFWITITLVFINMYACECRALIWIVCGHCKFTYSNLHGVIKSQTGLSFSRLKTLVFVSFSAYAMISIYHTITKCCAYLCVHWLVWIKPGLECLRKSRNAVG